MPTENNATAFIAQMLFGLWSLVSAVYFVCFAFGIVHWNSFRIVAGVSTFALMAFTSTGAARQYDGNRFMLRYKKWMLPGFFGCFFLIIGIEAGLRGTPYQTGFLGLLLAVTSLTVGYFIILRAVSSRQL